MVKWFLLGVGLALAAIAAGAAAVYGVSCEGGESPNPADS